MDAQMLYALRVAIKYKGNKLSKIFLFALTNQQNSFSAGTYRSMLYLICYAQLIYCCNET